MIGIEHQLNQVYISSNWVDVVNSELMTFVLRLIEQFMYCFDSMLLMLCNSLERREQSI